VLEVGQKELDFDGIKLPKLQPQTGILTIFLTMSNFGLSLKPWEREYLEPLLQLCLNLHLEKVLPKDPREMHFLTVLNGNEKPKAAYEFLYLRVLLQYQLHLKAGPHLWNEIFYCNECSSLLPRSVILDGKADGVCTGCNGRRQPKTRLPKKTTVSKGRGLRAPQASRPPNQPSGTPVSQLFSYKYGGEPKGTGIYQTGGFADYDYDKESSHRIPRKKR
jgi:hypothetical protein